MKNTQTIKLSKNFLTIDGVRAGVRISNGPWVPQCNPDMIKITPKKGMFPRRFSDVLKVQNESDIMTDYFAPDQIKLFPGDALYEEALKAI
jgi:hypothetical protein